MPSVFIVHLCCLYYAAPHTHRHTHTAHPPQSTEGTTNKKLKTAREVAGKNIPKTQTKRPCTVYNAREAEWRKHFCLESSLKQLGWNSPPSTQQSSMQLPDAKRKLPIISVWICIFVLSLSGRPPLHPLFSVLALVLYWESKNADTRSLCTWQGLDTTGYMHFLTLPGLPLLGVSWGEMCLYLFYAAALIDRNTKIRESLAGTAVWGLLSAFKECFR